MDLPRRAHLGWEGNDTYGGSINNKDFRFAAR
jgi:hypothetical protein